MCGINQGFPGGASGKELACQFRRQKRLRFDRWVEKIPWRRAWKCILIFLPGESLGQRNLVGCSSWDHKESDMTEQVRGKREGESQLSDLGGLVIKSLLS